MKQGSLRDRQPAGFTGFEIKKDVENKFNRRVFVVNDAAAAFIGEAYFGAAENCKNAVMLTLGTGLGGAASINGKLLTGANFHAARIGHIPLHIGGRECNCGKVGCAEQYVSATGLCERQTSLTAAASTATEFQKSRRRRQKMPRGSRNFYIRPVRGR